MPVATIEQWRAKYWPEDTRSAFEENGGPRPDQELLMNSLDKWIGLRQENLPYEMVNRPNFSTLSGSDISRELYGHNCTLCDVYVDPTENGDRCVGCPIYESRGMKRCDDRRYELAATGYYSIEQVGDFLGKEEAEEDSSSFIAPWFAWQRDRNPEPMITALRHAIAFISDPSRFGDY